MKKYCLSGVFLFLSWQAHAQLSQKDVVRYLTNENKRTWFYKDYKITLGIDCSGDGQSFEFSKDGTAGWKKCADGHASYKSFTWTVKDAPNHPGEFNIILSEPLSIITGKTVSIMRINLILPKVKTRGTKMAWVSVPDNKDYSGQVIDFLSHN